MTASKAKTPLSFGAFRTLLFCAAFSLSLKAQEDPKNSDHARPEGAGKVVEKTLRLLRKVIPATISGKGSETVEDAGGLIYWGNLFDTREVVALVNLAPEQPARNPEGDDFIDRETWDRHLSLCAWERDHWAFRQYLDSATNVELHDRKDKPSHFVQASRKTGRYEGDHLSWYYDPKTRKLVRTNFESWGPFYLIGNYLCTLRGFERRAVDETVWVYPYKEGQKGKLLGIYSSDSGNGEIRNFAITFRDRKTGDYWTYSFSPEEAQAPYLHYNLDAAEGAGDEKANTPVHHHAKVEVREDDVAIDEFCFERLTGLSRAVLNHEGEMSTQWKDALPKLRPLKEVPLKITGDPEIARHLQKR
jgi:hypothetical protein